MKKETDYLELWRDLVVMHDRPEKTDRHRDVWHSRAARFDEVTRKRWKTPDSSREWVLDLLRRYPDREFLDIGAGTGAWTCLVAPVCRNVTALEPSPAMIRLLRSNIRENRLNNVTIINRAWPVSLDRRYDVSLCAHSIYGYPDFCSYIRAMEQATRHTCILLLRALLPDCLMAEISRKILGHPHDSPNFQVAYNALLQMGIFADVVMEDSGPWQPWTHENLESAVIDVKRKLGISGSDRHDRYLREVLKTGLRPAGNLLEWPESVRSVLVHWRPA